ncbi:hypothetical protein [Methylocaldum gracile]|jgi:hypothetical protein|uniref:hypothetical protein n=1 Tax=unclassified Methylocaldum TaxID=2622260 RepID=UPI00105EE72C
MTLHVEFWQLLGFLSGLLFSVFGAVFAGGKILLGQVEKRLDERFSSQEKSRQETRHHWDERFSGLETAAKQEAQRWQQVERELLQLKADLPLQYVRREDYVRNQSVIEAKLDGLAVRIENALLKGERHG